jgi:hypothetical protein
VELAGAVGYLLDYPYGCVEQTTSRLVPLIYLRELAELSNPGALGKPELDEVMEACFLRLRMMQTYSGGLAFWPGFSEPSEWGSLYAADVLVEAKKAGREVPDPLHDGLIRYLSQSIDGWASTDSKLGLAAYACYVLARAGSPQYSWMARLEEKMREAGAGAPMRLSAQARFHLAAAMIACGQKSAALPLVADARPTVAARSTGGALDSPAREEAVMLLVLLDADPQSPQIPALAERLRGHVKIGRWGTTQENAFAILALGKLASRLGRSPEAQVTMTLPDRSERRLSSREGITLTDLPPGSDVLVRAEGEGKLYAFWSAEGLAIGDEKVPEEDRGVSVRRAFFTPDGAKAVDPMSFEQGRLYQVRLSVTAPRALDNLVITDLLAACLEIENPDLRGSAVLQGAEQGACLNVAHVERRDDRMIIFADAAQGSGEYRYMVRAVSRGKFVLPPAEASCMYDPGISSVSGGGVAGVSK